MSKRKKKQNDALTADDLKAQMFQSMKSAGVVRQLKVQLRQTMINELRGKGSTKPINTSLDESDLIAATMHPRKSYSWVQTALDNLVLHHIKQSKYHYTMSLFEQESSVSSYSKSLTQQLIARLGLHDSDVDADSATSSEQLASTPKNNKNLIIWNILHSLSSLAAKRGLQNVLENKENVAARATERQPPMTIAEKFRAIDEEFGDLPRRSHRDPEVGVSVLASAVRRAEEDAARRAKISYEQWKSVDLTKMRLEEADKGKEKVNSKLEELEKDYQHRRDNLESRERSAVERLQHHRELMEKEMHQQRQTLLHDLEQIRTREESLRQREDLMADMEATNMKQFEPTPQTEDKTHQPTPSLRQESFVSSLAESIKHSHDGRQVITQQAMDQIMLEINEKSNETNQLKMEIEKLKIELNATRNQHHNETSTERENYFLKENLQELKREIENLKRTNHSTQESHKNMETDKLREEIDRLKSSKHEQDARERHLEDMLRNMKLALDDSSRALLHLSERPHAPVAPSYETSAPSRLVINHPMESIREYEPIDPDTILSRLAASNGGRDMSGSVGLSRSSHDVRQRIRLLDEETATLDEEYNRYLTTNYRKLMEARSNARVPDRTALSPDSSLKQPSTITRNPIIRKESPIMSTFTHQLDQTNKELESMSTNYDSSKTNQRKSAKSVAFDTNSLFDVGGLEPPCYESPLQHLPAMDARMEDHSAPLAPLDVALTSPPSGSKPSKAPHVDPEFSQIASKSTGAAPTDPDVAPNIPDVAPNIPDVAPNIPDVAPNIPDVAPINPDVAPKSEEEDFKLPIISDDASSNHGSFSSSSHRIETVHKVQNPRDQEEIPITRPRSNPPLPRRHDEDRSKSPENDADLLIMPSSTASRTKLPPLAPLKRSGAPDVARNISPDIFEAARSDPASLTPPKPIDSNISDRIDDIMGSVSSVSESSVSSLKPKSSIKVSRDESNHVITTEESASYDQQIHELPEKQDSYRDIPVKQDSSCDLPVKQDSSRDIPVKQDSSRDIPVKQDSSRDIPVKQDSSRDIPVKQDSSRDIPVKQDSFRDIPVKQDSSRDIPVKQDSFRETLVKQDSSRDIPVKLEAPIASYGHESRDAAYHLESSSHEDETISRDDIKNFLPEDGALSYSSHFSSEPDERPENRFAPTRKLPDFESGDDISDILRWEDQHRPRLDSEVEHDSPRDGAVETTTRDSVSEVVEERPDPFEMSDPQLSLDSQGKAQTDDEDSW